MDKAIYASAAYLIVLVQVGGLYEWIAVQSTIAGVIEFISFIFASLAVGMIFGQWASNKQSTHNS